MKALAITVLTSMFIATNALVVARAGNTAMPIDWSTAQRVEIRMIEYEFVPNLLRFRRGQPYQLHLVNAGKEGHDFTAEDFFTLVHVENIDALNPGGTSVFLQPGQAIDIYFITQNAGLFAPRCADHDWAGMTAAIVVD